ncbi:TetR/AcrR family transcriptional regulator [Nonomuraea rhodomycinica]|uniref:TetR family transcriptional regulator n=1 Tax=Nonomuraea rhodomycinica TaxID=1712872 RepID=A0A7Y6INA2_9ACTN|nr:TetR/AcrR family transcriptional regulator [Nonomuraea rhodomycinica]NUW41321.1 TetR family transcriptional regulator [Nonomuraea rhodomycinica]
MSRRQELADVAITLLASEGMRGLTHRAVDRAAELPQGSTSYYFRTRQALLRATVERLAEHTASELSTLHLRAELPTGSADDLVEAVAELVDQWLTTSRDRQLARYELSLEATRRPELREVLVASRARVRGVVTRLLDRAGVRDADLRADDLMAYADGLIFDCLVNHPGEAVDLRPKFRALLATVGRD